MDTSSSQAEALLQAIETAGSQTALAERLTEFFRGHPDPELKDWEVTQGHVGTWLMRNRVAGRACRAIELLTGVSANALRPDLFYGETRL